MRSNILKPEFFQSDDVVQLAKHLIGCRICTKIDGKLTSGLVTETEAYAGKGDKACHAHLGKFTKRTAVMYQPGGVAYIYLCYGIHHLFNIVTNTKDNADAILIRAFEPDIGIKTMQYRRGKLKIEKSLTSGPGNVSQALGLSLNQNTRSVYSDEIWFEKKNFSPSNIVEATRIGIGYAEEDTNLPWRFYNGDSGFVSVR